VFSATVTKETSPRQRVRSVLVAAAAVALVGASTPHAEAAARTVQCGQELTKDTVLTSDLTCSGEGQALTVAADGVVLDLAGHSITGDTGNGIYVNARDVVVRGGTVAGFQRGILVAYERSASVQRMNLKGNYTGLESNGDTTLSASRVGGNTLGVLASIGRTSIVRNEVSRNVQGVVSEYGASTQVRDSVLRSNQWALVCNEAQITVQRSTVADSGTSVRERGCRAGTITRSLFLANDEQLEAGSSSVFTFACTTFVLGAPAPTAVAPCGRS
jgi:hypothetical protein